MISRFLKDGAIYAVSGILTRGLSFFLLPLYTRIFSPSDYGALDMLLTFGTLVHLTVALEISQGMARYYGDSPDEDSRNAYGTTAFWFTLFAYTVFLIVGLCFAERLSHLVIGKSGFENLFRLGLFNLWINGLFNILQGQFRWGLNSRKYAVASLIVAIVSTAGSIVLAYGMAWGLYGVIAGLAAGAFFGLCYALSNLRHSLKFHVDLMRLKEMLRFSLPLIPSSVAVFTAYYIDRFMIRHFLSLDDVGIYGVAFRLASVTSLIMVGFQMSLTPLIMTHYREKETPAHIAAIFRIFVAFSLVLFMGLGLFAKEILFVMTTPEYYGAAIIVAFLTPAILLSNMYIFAPGTGIAKKTYHILWINVMGAILNILLNFVMIPAFGIIGACIATMINYGCVFAAYVITGQRLYPVPYDWKILARATLATVLLVIAGLQFDFGPMADFAVKSLLIIVGCAIIVFFRLVSIDELRNAKKILSSKLLATRPEVDEI